MYVQKFGLRKYHQFDGVSYDGHFTTLRSRMRDANLLKAALRALGIPVQVNADVRGPDGQTYQADIVAVLEGRFDIGYSRADDGSFNIIVDLWGLAQRYNNGALINGIYQQYLALKEQAETPENH